MNTANVKKFSTTVENFTLLHLYIEDSGPEPLRLPSAIVKTWESEKDFFIKEGGCLKAYWPDSGLTATMRGIPGIQNK